MPSSKFDQFNITDVEYKKINGHAIETSILVPKAATDGNRPVPILVHFHGGGLVLGSRLFEPWFSNWLIELAKSNDAIIISPDYRLLPESSGMDILNDLTDFWTWFRDSFTSVLYSIAPGVEADLSNVFVAGESAGGYLAIQSILLAQPGSQPLAMVVAQYPMLDLEDWQFNRADPSNAPFDLPGLPREVLDNHLSSLKPGTIITERVPPAGGELISVMLQHGIYNDYLGTEEVLFPFRNIRLAKARGTSLPPLWIAHGKQDAIVPVGGTERFAKEASKSLPEWKVHVSLQEGDHGFDNETPTEADWIQQGLAFAAQYWPRN